MLRGALFATRRLISPLLLWHFGGCGSEAVVSGPVIDDRNHCSSTVQPVVTDSVRGKFTWSPACGVDLLIVERQQPGDPFGWDVMWVLQPWSKLIFPPIDYGTTVDGAIAPLTATPPALQPGRTYRVWVSGRFFAERFPSATWTVP